MIFAWEQCKLGDVADRVTRKNKGMVSELPLTISAQDGLISQDEFFNKKVASKDLSSYLLLHHGDFAYNKSYSNGYPFGTIKRLEKYPQGVVSSLYIAFEPNSSISSDFMAQYYESNNWHKEIYKCAAEGARNHGLLNVPPSDFFATNLNIPITKSEQLKIGRLLNAVDQTITLHEEKKRQLERLKSALLQKMFAYKSGYPAVRFEGFGGKWDQCKLGNVGTFRGGFGFPENEQGNIDGIAFYKVSDMNDSCNTLTMRKASNYVTSSQISKNKWKPILNQNIIFAKVGAAVYLERKRKAMGPFLLDNNMMAFQPKDADIDYIYYVFQRLRISKHAQVGTLPSLNASELRNITIYIPSLNEQKAVADLMASLDHTIILYDFKLELLKKLKSSLLQHMFI
ncbi:restriction endonuclease subunit S [Lactobacillus delbrueckii]|uniref:restriction endonuclease subunit S n=1 Tax=Lactobacillus delbrueckii TaxID=1584 RepID=UPI001E3C0FF3|nr:restriction endonuclease subunit S [Lactobacillus delbrueckii subsp. lactis]